jgi:hypothetical protein
VCRAGNITEINFFKCHLCLSFAEKFRKWGLQLKSVQIYSCWPLQIVIGDL